MASEKSTEKKKFNIFQIIFRFIAGMIVLSLTAAVTPWFSIEGGLFSKERLITLFLVVLVLSVVDYLLLRLLKLEANVFGKGMVGFLLAAAILYLVKYVPFIDGYDITIPGALIAALVYGIIDAIIPGKTFLSN